MRKVRQAVPTFYLRSTTAVDNIIHNNNEICISNAFRISSRSAALGTA